MKTRLLLPLVAAALAMALSLTAAKATGPSKAPHIVLVGDSTVTDGSGWGAGFRKMVTPDVIVTNTAQNGRSSKSFRSEGHWAKALAARGDYYLIQFGHNDQPGKGPDRETDAATTYAENMSRYVEDVRALGAKPILVTSLVRRNFDPNGNGRIVCTLGPYVEAVKKVAEEKHVPVIDLHALSLAYCEKLGPVAVAALNPMKSDGKPDTTHLDEAGSLVFARLIATDLKLLIPELAAYIRTPPDASHP